MTRLSIAIMSILTACAPVMAADPSHDMHEMHKTMQGNHDTSNLSEADKAYAEANKKMHEAMSVKPSGNADVDFAQGMIPHHQGAIDMANVVLKYGKDPEIKKLAQDIIKAQEGEIAFLKGWLETHK